MDADELIRHWCRTGDEDSFSIFYRDQSERLWCFLVARGVHPEGAYDVVADSFERFVKSVCRDPGQPVALLYRIAINASTDAWRRQRVRTPAEAVDPEQIGAHAGGAERLAEVDQLLEGLDDFEQNLLLLRYWIGLTHREVAAILEKPEGTVRRHTAELLARLRPGGEA